MTESTIDYVPLKDEFLENPFSVLEVKTKRWQQRKKEWLSLGLNNEVARENLKSYKGIETSRIMGNNENPEIGYVSTFDPYLAEIMYKWFCVPGGRILDPFAGSPTRGVVAGKLGYYYTGIDVRREQVSANITLSRQLLDNHIPTYLCGDSRDVLRSINGKFDLVFTCPPYYNLEIYSNLDNDLSNMSWIDFRAHYKSIIEQCCSKLNKNGYAVFVVGEVRNRSGFLYGLVPYTIECFMKCGMIFYNELILSNPLASAAIRARQGMKSGKVVKVHQNVLVFKKNRIDLERARETVNKIHGW